MNCEQIQEHLVDYLYGELPADLVEAVESELEHCSECAATLDEMRHIHDLVTAMPRLEIPPHAHNNILRQARLAAAESSQAGAAGWLTRLLFSPAFATAAVVCLVLTVGVLLQQRGTMPGSARAPEPTPQAAQSTLEGGDGEGATQLDTVAAATPAERSDSAEPPAPPATPPTGRAESTGPELIEGLARPERPAPSPAPSSQTAEESAAPEADEPLPQVVAQLEEERPTAGLEQNRRTRTRDREAPETTVAPSPAQLQPSQDQQETPVQQRHERSEVAAREQERARQRSLEEQRSHLGSLDVDGIETPPEDLAVAEGRRDVSLAEPPAEASTEPWRRATTTAEPSSEAEVASGVGADGEARGAAPQPLAAPPEREPVAGGEDDRVADDEALEDLLGGSQSGSRSRAGAVAENVGPPPTASTGGFGDAGQPGDETTLGWMGESILQGSASGEAGEGAGGGGAVAVGDNDADEEPLWEPEAAPTTTSPDVPPPDSGGAPGEAMARADETDTEEAQEVGLSPQALNDLYNEGLARYNAGLYRDAIGYFDELVQNAPPSTELFVSSNFYQGQARMQIGDYRGAQGNFSQIRDRSFEYYQRARILLAKSYEFSGDLDRAEDVYNEMVGVNDEDLREEADAGLERIRNRREELQRDSTPSRASPTMDMFENEAAPADSAEKPSSAY